MNGGTPFGCSNAPDDVPVVRFAPAISRGCSVVRPERARRQEARLSTCGFAVQAARFCEVIRASEYQPAWRRYSKTVSGSFPGGTTSR